MSCEIGTIREMHSQLVNEGIHVSEHSLRLWIKGGSLPAVYTEKKALISHQNVLNLLAGSIAIPQL